MQGATKGVLSLVFLFDFVTACGGASRIDVAADSSVEYSGESLEGGAITEITLGDNNQGSLVIGNVDDSADYVLALTTYNTFGSLQAYEVGAAGSLSGSITSQLLLRDNDMTEDFHDRLRLMEQALDPAADLRHIPKNLAATRAKTASVGDTRTFHALNSFSGGGSSTVAAELRYQTANFNAYVDIRNEDSLSDDELEDLLENFDAMIADERRMYGDEADVDGDGRFNILFTQAVNELGASAGGIVTGYYYAINQFAASVYSQSDETEIFYTFVPDPSGSVGAAISKEFALSNILRSVLPHEYQHMINFNMHYFENDGAPEQSFLNEALAHLAEDIYSLNGSGYMTTTGLENPARIDGYLDSIDSLCLTCGASLYQRGGGYLLVRYLYEQAEKGNLAGATDGADFLYKLLNTTETGADNIVQAAFGNTDSVEEQFADLMQQFSLAVFLDDTGLSSDDRFVIDGINLRAVQEDNRGTVLQGPAIQSAFGFPFTSTLASSAVSYVSLSGAEINDMGGVIEVQLSSTGESAAFLIQTGI